MHAGQNIGKLTRMTRVFRDAMFDSTLPWFLIDSAAARVSVLRQVQMSKTVTIKLSPYICILHNYALSVRLCTCVDT